MIRALSRCWRKSMPASAAKNAISEGRRAVDLMPISKDAYDGPLVLQGLAQIYVWTGEKERAIEVLEKLVRFPGYVAYGYLLRDPIWDPLHGDPRFEKILASLAPKENSFRVALRFSRAAVSMRLGSGG